jgi:miniconductance mechanosensitive channel
MRQTILGWLAAAGLSEDYAAVVLAALSPIVLLIVAWVANGIARRIIATTAERVAQKTETTWDDVLAEHRVFARLSHLAPALVLWIGAAVAFHGIPDAIAVTRRIAETYMIVVCLFALSAFLDAAQTIYGRFEVARRIPIRGYVQVAKLMATFAGAVFILSLVLDKSPWVFLSGMGALTAILLLVFKDAILGFVAGIQLVANDMVRPGDWIEMPKYGADGDVVEVTLTTVKVRNWDKTITTVPTYSLISDSFKNWRGMTESGGRRIKRSISIDVDSVRHCDDAMLDRFEKLDRIRDYVRETRAWVDKTNREASTDGTIPVNGRRMTNVGTFRKYLEAYLREIPEVREDMTFLVRQLQPTERGLPIEIYCFSSDQRWVQYEAIQADIFDHVFASLPFFELRAFQFPSGRSIEALARAGGGKSV